MHSTFILCTILLVLSKLIFSINGWRPFRLDIINLTTTSLSPKCKVNSSVTKSSVINLSFEFLDIIRNPRNHVAIFIESTDGNYDMEIMNRTIDLCRFYKDIKYEPILQVGARLYKKSPNYPTKCPIAKGVYGIIDKEINIESLPPIFPEKGGYYKSVFMDKKQALFDSAVFFRISKVFKNH